MVMVELVAGESRVVACPALGGAIARLSWRGEDILRPTTDAAIAEGNPRRLGCFPLVPYSNRIALACLRFEGRDYPLRPNFAPEPHAVHGVGWRRPWRIGAVSSASAQFELAHEPDEDWPFRFEARQSLALGDGVLQVGLALRNTDARRAPAGLGFHPYFPLLAGLQLEAAWDGAWLAGEDKLPTLWEPVPPVPDFRRARSVEGWTVDRCFTGWNRNARLIYPSRTVSITASPALDRLICYVPGDGRPFIAVEPVSHVNNAFAMAAQGHTCTGMRTLAPGEEFEVSMTIAVTQGAQP